MLSYVNTKLLPNNCLEEHGASRWRDVEPVLCPSIAGRAGGKEGDWAVDTGMTGNMEGPVCFFMVPQTFVISP